jgi:hypothetical protein
MAAAVFISKIENESDGKERWGSYNNIHKELKEFAAHCARTSTASTDMFFDAPVCISEKLDGSNLGIRVTKMNEKWTTQALLGRAKPIWTIENAKPITNLPKYGKVCLGKLPIAMKEFSAKVGDMLGVNDLLVFGEALHITGGHVSWHPFGFKTRSADDEWSTHFLTSSTHALFQAATGNAPLRTHAEFLSFMAQQSPFAVVPPPLWFAGGTLREAIEALHPILEAASVVHGNTIEGCFVVTEDNRTGFKWKAGTFEEQKGLPDVADLRFDDPPSFGLYAKLVDIFHTRPPETEPTPEQGELASNEVRMCIDLVSSDRCALSC